MEIATLSYKINTKFYVVEPTTHLDNQLQCRLSHLNRKLLLSRPNKPEGLKRNFETPKSHHNQTQQLENQQAKATRVEHYKQNNPKFFHISVKPTRMDTEELIVTIITKNTIQLKETSKTQMTSRNNCNNN